MVSNIWHVLDVPAGSPADLAGLLPYSDYILGSPEGALHGESGLSEIVEDHIGRPLRLWVYNNEYDVTREVTLQPSREWGGEGALGCVLGYGALHRLPAPLSEPVDAPGETMFDGGFSEKSPYPYGAAVAGAGAADFFTPADQTQVGQPPAEVGGGASGGDFLVPAQLANAPPPPRSNKKKDRHAQRGAGNGIDDYFNEEEQKSREMDRPEGTRSKSPLAPPPKAGGPPKSGPPKAETPPAEAAEGGEAAA